MNKMQFKLKRLLLFLLFLINDNVIAQTDTLSFFHITDLHVIFNQEIYPPDMMEKRKQKQYDQGENRLRQFLQTIPVKKNGDMVIATGDLVDFVEAETIDNKKLPQKQFSRLINNYHVPVYLALGNHDLFSFIWEGNKLKHNQNFSGRSRAAWIRNVSCFKNGTYYSKIFHVGATTYRLIFLDNSFYQFTPKDKTGIPYVDKSQLYWLTAQLHELKDDIEIIIMHIPFQESLGIGRSSNDLYSAISKNPSCKLILAGHEHKNLVTSFPFNQNQNIVQVQTGALVQSSKNWRLVRLTEKNILVSVPGKTENELAIQVK